MSQTTDIQSAERAVRECARQHRAGEVEGPNTPASWRAAAREAGDRDLLEALDLLGDQRAAEILAER